MVQRHSRITERVLTRLKLKQLRLLLAVGRHRSILNASKELNLSQPAATKMIKDLELDFEVQLFERTNRGVIPTVFGEALIRHGKLIFAQVSNAAQELDDLNEGASGRIVVGTLLAASPRLLPAAISATLAARPNVAIKVVEGTNEVLMPALRAGELDMVVGRLPTHRHRGELAQVALFDERIVAVARPGHPLAGRRRQALAALLCHGWILPPVETSLRRQLDQLFIARGRAPSPMVESVSYLTNRSLLAASDLIGVMPAHVAAGDIAAGGLVELDAALPLAAGPVGVSYRKATGLSPAAAAFLTALEAAAEGL